MRILIAGASGAIGTPLVRRLRASQHEVFALARPPGSAQLQKMGAEPVVADARDAAAVKEAVGRIRPDAVINELTSLPKHYTPYEMKAAAERDHKVRVEGNVNLLAAIRDAGVRRYLLQSSGFWYAPGVGLADESVPFIVSASPGVEAEPVSPTPTGTFDGPLISCATPHPWSSNRHRRLRSVAGAAHSAPRQVPVVPADARVL